MSHSKSYSSRILVTSPSSVSSCLRRMLTPAFSLSKLTPLVNGYKQGTARQSSAYLVLEPQNSKNICIRNSARLSVSLSLLLYVLLKSNREPGRKPQTRRHSVMCALCFHFGSRSNCTVEPVRVARCVASFASRRARLLTSVALPIIASQQRGKNPEISEPAERALFLLHTCIIHCTGEKRSREVCVAESAALWHSAASSSRLQSYAARLGSILQHLYCISLVGAFLPRPSLVNDTLPANNAPYYCIKSEWASNKPEATKTFRSCAMRSALVDLPRDCTLFAYRSRLSNIIA